MTAVKAPSTYVSGWCGSGSHDRCRGLYGGVTCCCPHHTEPEPEPRGLRIGSLFSGYGGLEQGVQSVLGGTVAWHSEIDPGACKILAHRHPDVPNLGDITAVDWAAVEPVDVLTGGFPCQDVSAAGKRLGLRPDTRSGLWTQFAYAIDQLRPPLVVVENVRGLLSADAHSDVEPCPWCVGDGDAVLLRALGAVLGDLAGLGYDASWHGLRAADVGAPHGRFRIFVVAWPATDTLSGRRDGRSSVALRRQIVGAATAGGSEGAGGGAADPDAAALGRRAAWGDDGVRAEGLVSATTDADLAGLEGCQPARGRVLPGGGTAAHPEGHGRHEGRPEPARLIGGPDVALGGDDAAADPARRGLPSEREGHRGSPAEAAVRARRTSRLSCRRRRRWTRAARGTARSPGSRAWLPRPGRR